MTNESTTTSITIHYTDKETDTPTTISMSSPINYKETDIFTTIPSTDKEKNIPTNICTTNSITYKETDASTMIQQLFLLLIKKYCINYWPNN